MLSLFKKKKPNKNIDNDNKYIPFRLESLGQLLIGCKLTNNGISIIISEDDSKYTEEQIEEAVIEELIPHINNHLNVIEKGM